MKTPLSTDGKWRFGWQWMVLGLAYADNAEDGKKALNDASGQSFTHAEGYHCKPHRQAVNLPLESIVRR